MKVVISAPANQSANWKAGSLQRQGLELMVPAKLNIVGFRECAEESDGVNEELMFAIKFL
jgi:hypothetical protein